MYVISVQMKTDCQDEYEWSYAYTVSGTPHWTFCDTYAKEFESPVAAMKWWKQKKDCLLDRELLGQVKIDMSTLAIRKKIYKTIKDL